MALLSFRGIDTPSLPAQGEQRRLSLFNIRRAIPKNQCIVAGLHKTRVPYEWPDGYPVASELPGIDVADINHFLNELDGGDR